MSTGSSGGAPAKPDARLSTMRAPSGRRSSAPASRRMRVRLPAGATAMMCAMPALRNAVMTRCTSATPPISTNALLGNVRSALLRYGTSGRRREYPGRCAFICCRRPTARKCRRIARHDPDGAIGGRERAGAVRPATARRERSRCRNPRASRAAHRPRATRAAHPPRGRMRRRSAVRSHSLPRQSRPDSLRAGPLRARANWPIRRALALQPASARVPPLSGGRHRRYRRGRRARGRPPTRAAARRAAVTRSPVPSTSAPVPVRKNGTSEPSARATASQSCAATVPSSPSIAARRIAAASDEPPPRPAPVGMCLRNATASGASPAPAAANARTTRLPAVNAGGSHAKVKCRAAGSIAISSSSAMGSITLYATDDTRRLAD